MNINILKQLVSFNTTPGQSNMALIKYVKEILKDYGFKTKIFKSGDMANLFAYRNLNGPKIIFASHTDTVGPSKDWKTNPYKLGRKRNRLIGLGVCDMKNQIAITLELCKKITAKNLAVLLTFNEETDFAGANLISNNQISKDDIVIIGEPTQGKAILATKGVASYEIILKGRTAHGSEPDKGISATLESARFLNNLANDFELFANKAISPQFDNPKPTLNIGQIEGGDSVNKIADLCKIALEIRFSKSNQVKTFEQLIKKNAKSLKSKLAIKQIFMCQPFYSSAKIKLLCEESNIEIAPGVSYATEASIYRKFSKNIIILGAGDIKNAHKPNESISLNQINKYEDSLEKKISNLAIYKR